MRPAGSAGSSPAGGTHHPPSSKEHHQMTTVNISGTFSEKQRPNNGLERVADYMDANRIAQVPIVGLVEWHTNGESKTGKKVAVMVTAVEPGFEADGSDPTGV